MMIGKRAFVPFVTAGYPDIEMSEKIILALAQAGADLIEVGIPFSDPVADGPVIQASSQVALEHGYQIDDYLEMVKRIKSESPVKLVFMSYLNPVLQYGFEKLDRDGAASGLDGILISDMIPGEYFRFAGSRTGSEEEEGNPLFKELKTVLLVAPNSTEERIADACRVATGYIYLVSRTGVTGGGTDLGGDLEDRLQLIRRYTSLPVAVGFGIRSAADVERVWEYAEGAIIGSAIVKFISENVKEPDLDRRVYDFVKGQLIPA
jgi:tryptophan synthase alpha chain